MKRTGKIVITLVTALLLVLTGACAPAPGEITPTPTPTPEEVTPPPTVEWGTIEIRVTDPGVAGVDSAIVTAENIEIHPAGADDDGWITIITDPEPFDLVYLAETEGEEILGAAEIVAGNFTGIRMDVIKVEGVITGGGEYTADVPSGKLRIVRPFNVGGDGVKTILTLDFDLTRSLITRVIQGEPEFLFKPVVRLKVEHSSPPETGGDTTPPVTTLTDGEDTTPPEITVTGVTEGQQYSEPVTPVISVSDDTDLDPTVTATLNGKPFTSGTEVTKVGEYELVVTAIDASGNETEVAVNFEIVEVEDITAPVITITGVTEGQVINSPDTVTPVFEVSDDTDLDPTVTATLNGKPFTSGTEVTKVGEYELVVTAIDASGNEAEVEVNFEIEEEVEEE